MNDTTELENMARRLTELKVHDAAMETESVLAYIQHAERQINARISRLSSVWKAVEWVASSDWGKDRFEKVLEEYRNQ